MSETIKQLYTNGELSSFPYWAAIWPSAVALSEYLQLYPELVKGKSVLEIAAGLGLPSLVAAKTALKVYCTDIDADAVEIARQSAVLNGITNMQFEVANWSNTHPAQDADVLLLSDVNYNAEAFSPLLELVMSFIQRNALVILATPQRLMAKPFIEQLLPYCQHTAVISGQTPQGQSADISIFCIGATASRSISQ